MVNDVALFPRERVGSGHETSRPLKYLDILLFDWHIQITPSKLEKPNNPYQTDFP